MDVIDHHQSESVFSKLPNIMWWNFHEGWRNKYIDRDPVKGRIKWLGGLINKPVQITDAWHFFKMLMIIFMCTAMVTALYLQPELELWHYPLILLGSGTTWNMTFTLFYHKLLRLKQ